MVVTDGNFKADHVKQKNPEDDVSLTGNGEAYMTADARYKAHINATVEEKQVRSARPVSISISTNVKIP